MVNMKWETHGGEDVGVFAIGPWAHLFVGNYEQNFIPYAISYAAQMGPGAQYERPHEDRPSSSGSADSVAFGLFALIAPTLLIFLHSSQ